MTRQEPVEADSAGALAMDFFRRLPAEPGGSVARFDENSVVPVIEVQSADDDNSVVPGENNSVVSGGKVQSGSGKNSVVSGEKSSVVQDDKIQSFSGRNQSKTTELSRTKTTEKSTKEDDDDGDDWRFEIKRKKRTAGRKNSGSTAHDDWYYWVIQIRKRDGAILYYGTLDELGLYESSRLEKYWRRSQKRNKVGKNA